MKIIGVIVFGLVLIGAVIFAALRGGKGTSR
jgi:hypothetical protein